MGHIAPDAAWKLVKEGRVNGVDLEEGGTFVLVNHVSMQRR